jgi:hypothetical protein
MRIPRDLTGQRERVTLQVQGRPEDINILNIFHTTRTKMSAYANRESANDRSDIAYMLRTYSREILGIADRISMDDCQFYVRDLEDRVSGEEVVEIVRRILRVPEEDEDDD